MPKTAMVLAAGLGTRMRPLTDDKPKPLINVARKPLIDYALDRFADADVERAIVNVHYLADMMEAHVIKRNRPEIIISDERELLLETGGGLKRAREHFVGEEIFCTNTDAILIDGEGREPCQLLSDIWDTERMDALLLLAPIKDTSGYDGAGDFDLAPDGRIEFRSRDTAPYVFTGLQILKTSLLDGAPDGPFSMKRLWDKAMDQGSIYGAIHEGFWMHVGDSAGLEAAEARLSENTACK